ncbi:probable RNA-binding protein CG14230 [Teleopsis dalmanni]|uniref:probable RNA-binding protein CG14230 n=1 Tax=Teleopsis dalmanni TaxID=139649 RepID=UPI0018CDC780|nr:probable RNA-binding protein CG14230 [Teleopsis dalmanni]
MMAPVRFFVSNLPQNIEDKDLIKLFQKYGKIQRVEIKLKENLLEPGNLNIIAFVTLEINERDVNYCLNELKWYKIKESVISVSLAKESFLDRLDRERQEAKQTISDNVKVPKCETIILKSSFLNTKKKFDEDSDLNADIDSQLLIAKKSAANSISNGKIVIQNLINNPIHIISQRSEQLSKKLDPKSSSADQKRKESLMKMKNQYNKNKLVIQQALSGLEFSMGKKIKFTEEEDNMNKQTRTNIFGFDDETNKTDPDVYLKNKYNSLKSEKLFELQKKNTDSRFRIDARFLDENENVNCYGNQSGELDSDIGSHEERNWQLDILEQVVGTKLNTEKSVKNKKMLRFDPSNDEHQKYLHQNKLSLTDGNFNENKICEKKILENYVVSKDVFYEVSNTLTQSLKTKTYGFSLLNMFGKEENLNQREKQFKKNANKKILLSKSDILITANPFPYDSSSASENELEKEIETSLKDKTWNKLRKNNVITETFFMSKNDARLKDGYKFYKYNKKSENQESYENVRNQLKYLIKTKINKNKKNVTRFRLNGQIFRAYQPVTFVSFELAQ